MIAVSDDAGAVMESFTYSPYGVAGGSSSGFPFRYTGQKLDPETGLYYYKARYYDPETGRFLQADPIGYADQMNLYAYVYNDPVNVTDTTGECPWCIVGAVVSGGLQLASEVVQGNIDLSDGIQKSDLQAGGRVAVAALSGAVGGGAATAIGKAIVGNGIKAAGARVAANAVAGAANGAATGAATSGVNGENITVGGLAKDAVVGAALSGGGAALGEGIEATGRAIANTSSLKGAADQIDTGFATAGNVASTVAGNADKVNDVLDDKDR